MGFRNRVFYENTSLHPADSEKKPRFLRWECVSPDSLKSSFWLIVITLKLLVISWVVSRSVRYRKPTHRMNSCILFSSPFLIKNRSLYRLQLFFNVFLHPPQTKTKLPHLQPKILHHQHHTHINPQNPQNTKIH